MVKYVRRNLGRGFKRSTSSKLGKRTRTVSKRRQSGYGRAIGSAIGRIAGSYIGLPRSGSKIGRKLGKTIGSVFGHGDYFTSNMMDTTRMDPGDQPPQFQNVNSRTVRVQHREYIQDIISGASMVNGASQFDSNNGPFALNPGSVATFPWLSSVAANFECYNLKGMIFEYKTTSADSLNTGNIAIGSVIMATSYNAANPSFSSKQEMENYEFAQSTKPSRSMCHYVECKKGSKPLDDLYVRVGAVPTGQSIQMYDVGTFNIATVGFQAASVNCGELWVTYDIELSKPKLSGGAISNEIYYAHYALDTNVYTPTSTRLFSTAGSNNANWPVRTGATAPITLSQNQFLIGRNSIALGSVIMIQLYIIGSGSTTAVAPQLQQAQLNNLQLLTSFYANASNSQITNAGTNGFLASYVMKVTSTTGAIYGTFTTGGVMPTTVLGGDLIFTQLPGNAA